MAKFIADERPTTTCAVPTIWADLLRYSEDHEVDFSSLQRIMCGGAAVPRALMEAFQERFGIRMLQAWGMTETSPVAAVSLPPRGVPLGTTEEMDWRALTGRPLPGVELRIVDDDGTVLPWDGEAVGEIQCRGSWITGSYYGDPAPEKFDDGWLRTGDIASVTPNGYVKISDRSKDVIKSGGEWISSVELEGHLMAHPDVVEAAVIAVPDARWDERPLACVVRRDGAAANASDLRDFLGVHVAKWQLPERWTFIAEVPKTSVGKFDKKVLRAQYADGDSWWRSSDSPAGRSAWRVASASTAMTTTLAASVFERLGDELWLLVPAFAFALLAAALIGRVLGVRRSFAATLMSGTIGWVVGVVVSLWIAADAHPATDGFARNLFLFSLLGTMAAAVWLEFLARPGIVMRAQTGLQSVPHPVRSLRRRGRRVQRYAEITRIAVRNGLGPSLGPRAARTTSRRRAAVRRCGGCGSRSKSAAACS